MSREAEETIQKILDLHQEALRRIVEEFETVDQRLYKLEEVVCQIQER